MRRDTKLQHLGEEFHHLGAVTPPIFQTSLFVHETFDSLRGKLADSSMEKEHYVYSRVGNPNLTMVEKKLAMLEGTEDSLVFGSGMAAISAAILYGVRAGDHVVCVDTAYGPTRSFLLEYLPGIGVETTMVVGVEAEEIFGAVRDNTKLIYLESPSSILFRAQDLAVVTGFARERGILTLIDNSNCSPIYQNPASMGVDIVLHSATKYLAGHSDVVAGALCASREICRAIELREGQWLGARLAPFDAWLLLRGMRTLRLRVEEAQIVGRELFEFLRGRDEVAEIYYSGDPEHPQAGLIARQQSGHTSLVTIVPRRQEEGWVREVLERLRVFQMGVSWGGYESLAVPILGKPMDWPEEKWAIRFYGGLEDAEDLKEDIEQAFSGR